MKMKNSTPKFIRIQSSKTITVTCGLQHDDVTNKDAHVPDRLKVSPTWPKKSIMIRKGVGTYPSEIKEWKSVQALVKDGVFTIGESTDDNTEAKEIKTTMVKSIVTEDSAKSLEDLTK